MLHITEIMPRFTTVIVSGDRFEEDMYDESGLIEGKKGDLKEYQTVIAFGSSVRGLEVGDQVMINIKHFEVKKYDPNSVKEDMGMNQVIGYKLDWVTIEDEEGNSKDCLVIDEKDILFGFKGYETQGKPLNHSELILPKDSKIILN